MTDPKPSLRGLLAQLLAERNRPSDFADDEPLLVSGRIDSMDVINLVVFMEDTFGMDFAELDFDQQIFDSLDRMAAFVSVHRRV